MKALVVDDDDFVRFLLARTLRTLDVDEVLDCESASQAMSVARERQPDLAIVDLDLGAGPNGIDVAQALRRLLPAIAIIILSSYSDPRLLGASGELPDGAVYVSKRELGDVDALRSTIELVIEHPRGRRVDAAPKTSGRRLSDNQIEIMRLVAEGHSNSEIARRRSLTEPAVEKAIARLVKQLSLTPKSTDNTRVLITQAYYNLIGATRVRRE